MNWRSFFTRSTWIRDRLREFLHGNRVYYELSSCYDGFSFQIKCDEETRQRIDDFLDSLH